MEGEGPRRGPRLLDLIPKQRGWVGNEVKRNGMDEKKLELRLGLPLPGGGETHLNNHKESLFPRGFLENATAQTQSQRAFLASLDTKQGKGKGTVEKVSGVSPSPSPSPVAHGTANENSSIANNNNNSSQSQTRNGNTPVVGWPPIRSFRKNLASSSISKSPLEAQDTNPLHGNKNIITNNTRGLFVKINMDGIPIGRKINLNAYGGYDELSKAVDQLFRGLLAAQRNPLVSGTEKDGREEEQNVRGLLDGSGEYTLVYEDEEGDRVLVGDVPWKMFVSTARRLRVLKTSDLSVSSINSACRKRAAT